MSQNNENERRKILMVEHHAPGSLYTLELGRELKKYDDVTVFCKSDVKIQEEGMRWIPKFYAGGKGKVGAVLAYGKTLRDLSLLIRQGHFDVLHIQSFKNARVEMMLYRRLRRHYGRLVMTVHNVLPHEQAASDAALYGAFYDICDQLIVHNETSAAQLRERFHVPSEKISIIAHGAYQSYPIDKSLRKPDARTRFLLFGRIRPYKGVDVLLKAVSMLPEEARKRSLFVIHGKQYAKIDKTDYAALVRQYGLEDCVQFSSQRVADEEIPMLMANTDVGVFPYRNIYGSGVLLMSYTFGIPVIASDIPTFREETGDGQTGLLFRSEDPAALRDAILTALSWDQEQISRYQAAIKKMVDEKYNWKISAAKTAEAYRKMLRG